MNQVLDYLTEDGRDPFKEWLANLADRRARAKVAVRIERMEAGNLGDNKPVGGGVHEMRIDYGPGYRVYYARAGKEIYLLLIGGDKSEQQADIRTAIGYWEDWNRRQKL